MFYGKNTFTVFFDAFLQDTSTGASLIFIPMFVSIYTYMSRKFTLSTARAAFIQQVLMS